MSPSSTSGHHLASSTTTPLKAAHYVNALSSALVRGAWADARPGVPLPNGGESLDWNEAIRKWAKHAGGDRGREYVHLLHGLSLHYLSNSSNAHGHSLPGPAHDGHFRRKQERGSAEDEDFMAAGRRSSEIPATTSATTTTTTTTTTGDDADTLDTNDEGPSETDAQSADTVKPSGGVALAPPIIAIGEKPIVTSGMATSTSAAPENVSVSEKVPAIPSISNNEKGPAETSTSSATNHAPYQRSSAGADLSRSTGSMRSNPAPPSAGRGLPSYASSHIDLDGDEDEHALLRSNVNTQSSVSQTLGERTTDLAGSWAWVGVAEERREEVAQGLKETEALLAKAGSESIPRSERRTLLLLKAYHLHALGDHEVALDVLASVDWSGKPDQNWTLTPAAQTIDLIRGRTIQGMSYELSGASHNQRALEAYRQAIQLFASLPEISPNLSKSFLTSQDGSPAPSSSFASHHEAHRWIARALSRATVIQGRTSDLQETLRFSRTYHLIAREWPSSFRPRQRHAMLKIYLRALYASFIPGSPLIPPTSQKWFAFDREGNTARAFGSAKDVWAREIRHAIKQGQQLLGETTRFPRAGRVNWPVVDFIQECVDLWERGGCNQQEGQMVVKVLWWAMNYTFHSQSLLRHLVRLSITLGDRDDAEKVFKLYVQIVLKARQTEQPDIVLRLQSHPGDESEAEQSLQSKDADVQISESSTLHSDSEMDSDEDFVATLVLGAKMYCTILERPSEAWRYVVLASDVLRLAGGAISSRMRSLVEEVKGIVRAAMAIEAGVEPETRPRYQAQAIEHLKAADAMYPNSATSYHLAFVQTEARDTEGAISTIRSAIETDPTEPRLWHLLALLLTAKKDWIDAEKAIAAGIDFWEAREIDLRADNVEAVPVTVTISPHIGTKDYAATPTSDTPSIKLISAGHLLRISQRSASVSTVQTQAERLRSVISMRMTQAVIVEKLEGPSQAMLRQQRTFAYYASHSAGGSEQSQPATQTALKVDLGESYVAVDHSKRNPPDSEVRSTHLGVPDDSDQRSVRSVGSSRLHRLLPKHIHVPKGEKAAHRGHDHLQTASGGSSIHSRQTTPTHSDHRGSLSTPPPERKQSPRLNSRTPADSRVISDLWLQSAATFRRWGKSEQALGAIQEAEVADPSNPEVWVQLGLHLQAAGNLGKANEAFSKALLLAPNTPQAVINLSLLYLRMKQPDLAHGLLNPYTQGRGWDIPEAWLYLAKTCEAQGGRAERVRECLLHALRLEKGNTCRRVETVCPRWL